MVRAYFEKKENANRNALKYRKKGYRVQEGPMYTRHGKRYYVDVRR